MDKFGELVGNFKSKNPKPGDLLTGEILHVDEGLILLDIGAKHDAFVSEKELRTLESGRVSQLSIGDQISVYVLHTSTEREMLCVSIRKGKRQEDWDRAKACFDSGEKLELEITGQNQGGVTCSFGQLLGFVPNSHIPNLRKNDWQGQWASKEKLIGSMMPLKVIEADVEKKQLVMSGRGMGDVIRKRRLQELKVGEIVVGSVVSIVDYGVFVDLGGADGLIHISELEWHHVGHPSEVLQLGEEVKVLIMNIDVERERIGLSRKELLDNPWDTVTEKYSFGDHVEGTVTKVLDFGAFVQLSDGIVGLIHESEMGIEGTLYPRDVIRPGETIITRIVKIQPMKRKMSLSLHLQHNDGTISEILQKQTG
jgi:small subunit ribosomal protein S1